ncbi:T9SS type A sorting domain-containing protein, partial [candidate division KSB1 bacterium]|nr:T9SS type A sorting domain-containing protein [candidate division KSB1 bacterium]
AVTPAEIMVNHCTFYDIDDDALKLNNAVDAVVKNSIFNTIEDKVVDADSAAVYTSATVTYCDTLLTDGFGGFLTLTSNNIYAEDPEFADPANLNLQVSSFFASIAVGDDGTVVGDPRWGVITGVQVSESDQPTQFRLYQNYPNPFNPTTTIQYALPGDAQVKLVIFNVLGQKVKTLVDQKQKAGYQTVNWDGRDESGNIVGSGIYLFHIEAGEFATTRKMMMLK